MDAGHVGDRIRMVVILEPGDNIGSCQKPLPVPTGCNARILKRHSDGRLDAVKTVGDPAMGISMPPLHILSWYLADSYGPRQFHA